MGSFRILHVSDLHFAEVDGTVGFPDVLPPYPRGHHLGLVSSYDRDLAFGVARFALENQARIDAVLARTTPRECSATSGRGVRTPT